MSQIDEHSPIEPPVELRFDPPVRPRRRKRSQAWLVTVVVVLVALVGGGIWVSTNQQAITDQFTVWQFEPTEAVDAHVSRLALTDHGRFLYFASTPAVSDHDTFSTECPSDSDEENYGILGCYVPSSMTIYLFDVTDERLDGTEEVTAAHEMLHAAWDRLDSDTRAELSALLEVEYEKLSTDTAFVERMDFYARTEPGQRSNELHSIVGTESAELSPALEEYYAQYFTDRSIVNDLHVASNAVFVQLQTQADALIASLDALRESIESDYANYTSGYESLNADVEEFNRRADTPGAFPTQAAFNRERSNLIARQDSLDALYISITSRSDQYDALVIELDGVNSTAAELQSGLNIGSEVDSNL